MNPTIIFEAVTNAYGRTVFKPAAAWQTVSWRWHMPAGHQFKIHEAPKPEEMKHEDATAST